MWSAACLIFELITGGDYLFDPASGARYTKDDDHIAQIIELVGDFPKSVAFSGRFSSDFFNRRGELRHISKLRFWPLHDVLHDKYLLPRHRAQRAASFLAPMLRLNPEQRARAKDALMHPWLADVPSARPLPAPAPAGGALKPVEGGGGPGVHGVHAISGTSVPDESHVPRARSEEDGAQQESVTPSRRRPAEQLPA